jgi:nitroimidazol reductase NimA-like FMN-containing flavoprotein (pyridoxamine 5'-phosphate oxidase superfamily)
VPDSRLENLTEAECRALLAAGSFGRVAITVGALPAILPVNYALLDADVVFRTAEGSKLNAALQRAVVAFEIDGVDDAKSTGWSVLVVGHASTIWKQSEIEQAEALDLRPWAPGARDQFVRVTTGTISGRRIST